MVETQEIQILLRTAVVLSKFLEDAKSKGSSHARISNNTNYIINSYGKIALEAGIRKHTVADAFKANRSLRIPTLIVILEALGKSMTDFGKAYDRVTDSDILKFKEQSITKKTVATSKKPRK